jgi:hypothetical protein
MRTEKRARDLEDDVKELEVENKRLNSLSAKSVLVGKKLVARYSISM